MPADEPLPGMPADPAADVMPAPLASVAPDAAPYGVNADGTPKAKPGRKPGQRNGTGKAAQKAATAPRTPPAPSAKRTPAKPPQRKTQTDYRPGVTALLSEATGAVLTIGVLKDDPALISDAAALDNAAPAVAETLNAAADSWPLVAAVLDKVLTVGPHASGMLALVGLVGQIGVNHGWLPAGLVPGTMPRDQLAASYVQRRAAESEEFAAILAFAQKARGGQAAEQPAAS